MTGKSVLLYTLSVISLLWGTSLLGCIGDCDGFREEPSLVLHFEEDRTFTLVYGLKDEVDPIPSDGSNFFELPLALGQPSTTYIFESTARTDTLELFYTVDTGFESKRCGFTTNILDLRSGPLTTFDDLTIDHLHITIP